MKRIRIGFFLFTFIVMMGFFFIPSVSAEREREFNPNNFSTYGLGLKESNWNESVPEYKPFILYQTKKEGNTLTYPNLLPDQVDLRPYFPEVRNQGKFGTCVPFAMTALREYYIARDGGARGSEITYLSPSYMYYPNGPKDGMYIESALQILKREGVPPETERIYDINPDNIEQFKQSVTTFQKQNASPYKISSYQVIRQTNMINKIKQALANQEPVLVGIQVYPNFDATPSNGIVPPVIEKKSRGGHALVLVGYDETKEWFIVRNSWGTKFGDNGYAYIQYQTLLDMTDSMGYVIKPIQKQYPPFGVHFSTTNLHQSQIKFAVSAKNATEYELYKNNHKIQTFISPFVTDIPLLSDQSSIYHIVAKNSIGTTRSYPLSVQIPVLKKIKDAS
ncbi:peptidase C1 [Bacillus thuringiensis]|uniref:C1 family peptidase n=1 Tax=Bacillus thuringiensis TaxID=1428 RepID=UPI0010AB79F0|nr:C1 family peptidase [Bacillus thuringiensis]TJZ99678.1 peptidase C1 [Bacillus thuringiensis]